ncbi:MAG: hypothetical protein WBB28_02125 [Crinalium sp.]
MGLDVELIEELKAVITEDPFFFDMEVGYNPRDCGTAACFAGHIYLIQERKGGIHFQPDYYNPHPTYSIDLLPYAVKVLGIDEMEENALEAGEKIFRLGYWSEPFKQQYEECQRLLKVFIKERFGRFGYVNEYSPRAIEAARKQPQVLELKRRAAQIACNRLDHYVKTGQ